MIKILLIEDDKSLNNSICFFFRKRGELIDGCFCADEAFEKMEKTRYDIVLTDVMLPSVDGFEIAGMIRSYDALIPIIFITALDDMFFKEKGYNLGIDDYMTKPVDLNELALHINAIMRRTGIQKNKKLTVGNLTLDSAGFSAICDGEEISLTVREFNILFNFLSKIGETFTRSRLMENFWAGDSDSTLRAVDVYVAKIREKTKNCTGFDIVTVRGLGYKAILTGEKQDEKKQS